MNDLISRSALLEDINFDRRAAKVHPREICERFERFCDYAEEVVKEALTVDAEVVRHGWWVAVENTGLEEWCAPPIRCSNCGKTMPDVGAGFCPFCGQMNVEVQDVPQD